MVKCNEGGVDAGAAWLERAIVDGIAEILVLGANGDFRVPVEVGVKSGTTWGHGLHWSSSTTEYAEEEKFIAMNTYLDSEPARIELYLDYREGTADNFPQVALCDECAARLGGEVGELTKLEAQKAAMCRKVQSWESHR